MPLSSPITLALSPLSISPSSLPFVRSLSLINSQDLLAYSNKPKVCLTTALIAQHTPPLSLSSSLSPSPSPFSPVTQISPLGLSLADVRECTRCAQAHQHLFPLLCWVCAALIRLTDANSPKLCVLITALMCSWTGPGLKQHAPHMVPTHTRPGLGIEASDWTR